MRACGRHLRKGDVHYHTLALCTFGLCFFQSTWRKLEQTFCFFCHLELLTVDGCCCRDCFLRTPVQCALPRLGKAGEGSLFVQPFDDLEKELKQANWCRTCVCVLCCRRQTKPKGYKHTPKSLRQPDRIGAVQCVFMRAVACICMVGIIKFSVTFHAFGGVARGIGGVGKPSGVCVCVCIRGRTEWGTGSDFHRVRCLWLVMVVVVVMMAVALYWAEMNVMRLTKTFASRSCFSSSFSRNRLRQLPSRSAAAFLRPWCLEVGRWFRLFVLVLDFGLSK